jgi:anti-anti-sigma factor
MPLDEGLRIEVIDGRVLVAGELDLATVPLLRAVVVKLYPLAMRHGMDIDLDLGGVTFIDSSGLQLGLELRQQREPVHVVAASACVDRLLELTHTRELVLDADSENVRNGALSTGDAA